MSRHCPCYRGNEIACPIHGPLAPMSEPRFSDKALAWAYDLPPEDILNMSRELTVLRADHARARRALERIAEIGEGQRPTEPGGRCGELARECLARQESAGGAT